MKIRMSDRGASIGLTTSVLADSILEADGQENIFTPLIGKGVRLFIDGRPADSILLEINKNLKDMENSNNAYKEFKNLLDKADNSLHDKSLSKEDLNTLRSTIEEAKNTEKAKITDYAKDLAKKIIEYSDKDK